jgi:asparagine synthase (glutamine-hydrolysing)
VCGFSGELRLGQARIDPLVAESMRDRVAHRGPDDSGLYCDGWISLGSRRLSILDLSANGHMPMIDERSGLVLAYNGEIYNYRELRRELESKGESFRSDGDTEVLLKLLATYGVAALAKLRGMFAFACWDRRKQVLLLARDPFGIKPMYFFRDAERIVFGSEVKVLLAHPGVPRRMSRTSLSQYLVLGYTPSPQTFFEGVQKVPAGAYMLVGTGGSNTTAFGTMGIRGKVTMYWDPLDEIPETTVRTSRDTLSLAGELQSVLAESVSRHLISDVPVGLFLSGGLDSSAILAFMSRSGSSAISTFSVGFEGLPKLSELDRGRLVAKRFGSRHQEVIVGEGDVLSHLPELARQMDEPIGDAAMIPMYLLSRVAKQSVKVVLTGEGGDELFGGYRRYAADLLASSKWIPHSVLSRLARSLMGIVRGMDRLKRGIRAWTTEDSLARAVAWQCAFAPGEEREVLRADWWEGSEGILGPLRTHYERGAAHLDRTSSLMYLDQKTRLADGYCDKVDKTTMAAGLEARVPFLDLNVARFALKLPSHLKVKGLTLKYLLRKALVGVVPGEILNLPKRGFGVPVAAWFKGGLKETLLDVLSPASVQRRGVFNSRSVAALLKDFYSDRRPAATQIWLLMAFELWCRAHVDVPLGAGSAAGVSVN